MKRFLLLFAAAGLIVAEAPAERVNLLDLIETGSRGSSRSRQKSGAKRRQSIRVEHTAAAATNAAPVVVAPVTTNAAPVVATNAAPVIVKPVEKTPEKPTVVTTKKTSEPVGLSLIAAETLIVTNTVTHTITNTVTKTLTNIVTQVETLTNKVTQVETLTNKVTQVETLTNKVTQVETLTNTVTQVEFLTNMVTQVETMTNTVTVVVTNKPPWEVPQKGMRGIAPIREPGPPRITSSKVYYDRKDGYAVFTGKVHVDSEEYQLHAKKAYVFFEGTNELKRIVATGNVTITNAAKRAYGDKASYYRKTGMIVLYGDDKRPAEVRDESKEEDQTVRGSKIKFWTMSEQIEVVDAHISAPTTGGLNELKSGLAPK